MRETEVGRGKEGGDITELLHGLRSHAQEHTTQDVDAFDVAGAAAKEVLPLWSILAFVFDGPLDVLRLGDDEAVICF